MKEQLNFIYDGGRVRRFHAEDVIKDQNVAEHSFFVTALLLLIYAGEPDLLDLVGITITHDLPEHKTGDMMSPVKKKYPALKQLLDQAEEDALEEVGMNFSMTPEQKKKLKVVDYLDGLMYCIRERKLGNQRIAQAYKNYHAYLTAMELKGRARVVFGLMQEMWIEAHGKPLYEENEGDEGVQIVEGTGGKGGSGGAAEEPIDTSQVINGAGTRPEKGRIVRRGGGKVQQIKQDADAPNYSKAEG